MARQKGIIQLEGTMGEITFVKTKDGYFARKKSTLTGERVKNDASFKRVQENMAEFGRASKAGKVIRTAFRPVTVDIADSRVTSRLHKELLRVIRTDGVNLRGARIVQLGELGLLQGFNFNGGLSLSSTLYVQPTAVLDRGQGIATVVVPPFQPGKMVSAPVGATHFQLVAGLVQVDFGSGDYLLSQARSAVYAANGLQEVETALALSFEAGTEDSLLLALGIEFTQVVNGQPYPLNDSGYNALTIVLANQLTV